MDKSDKKTLISPNPKKPFLLPRSFTYHQSSHRQHIKNNLSNPNPNPNPNVILYTTSLRGVRRTHDDCCYVRSILRGFRIAIDERDVSMDADYRRELQSVVGGKGRAVSIPQLFVRGRHVGGAEEVRGLNEVGELVRLLEGVASQDPMFVCGGCGGVRFAPCGRCRGSRKVFAEEEGRMRRCENCNENGLVRCPECCSSSSC